MIARARRLTARLVERVRLRRGKQPAYLRSPDAWWALVCYAGTAYLGTINALDLQQARALGEWIGPTWVDWWSWARVLAGAIAFIGAVLAVRDLLRNIDPAASLVIEAVGNVLICLASALYLVSLVRSGGPLTLMETQGYAAIFAIGGLGRAVQIPFQIRHYRRVREGGIPADPTPLTDPRG